MVAGQAAAADGCHQWEPSGSGVGIEAVPTTRGVDGRKSLWWVCSEGNMVPTIKGKR
jgi:hypothetical protein